MVDKILLNDKIYTPSEADLPCLITYAEKTGGSQFSISLVANLFSRGSKILMLTAYPMARENFMEQISGAESKVVYVESIEELKENKTAQAIIFKSGDGDFFLEAAPRLKDLGESVIFIKNIEIFSESVLGFVLSFEKVILSGDIDKCAVKDKLLAAKFNTIVAFSPPEVVLPFEMPPLPKFQGYFWGKSGKGVITLEKGLENTPS